MNNKSKVLQAMSILVPEEILKLSAVLGSKRVPLKKAAGEEFIVWDEEEVPPQHQEVKEAKVLSFPKKIKDLDLSEPLSAKTAPQASTQDEMEADDSAPSTVMPSELVLWQREMAKDNGKAIQKLDAIKGYEKLTQMYVVKSPVSDGKEKIRFATTNGILVNKKQA